MRRVLVLALFTCAVLPAGAQCSAVGSGGVDLSAVLHTQTADTVRMSQGTLHALAIDEPEIRLTGDAAGVLGVNQSALVGVRYLVSAAGDVGEAVAYLGLGGLRQAAVDGVKRWRYRPYLLNGRAVPVESRVLIEFCNGVGKRWQPPPPLPGTLGMSGGSGMAAGAPMRSPDGGVTGAMSGGSVQPPVRTFPKPTGPVRVSSGVVAGSMAVSDPPPVYPSEARDAGVQGTVVLHAILSKEGAVKELSVISGPPVLGSAAVDAVRQWRYKPYILNGEPVEVETTINVNFHMDRTAP